MRPFKKFLSKLKFFKPEPNIGFIIAVFQERKEMTDQILVIRRNTQDKWHFIRGVAKESKVHEELKLCLETMGFPKEVIPRDFPLIKEYSVSNGFVDQVKLFGAVISNGILEISSPFAQLVPIDGSRGLFDDKDLRRLYEARHWYMTEKRRRKKVAERIRRNRTAIE